MDGLRWVCGRSLPQRRMSFQSGSAFCTVFGHHVALSGVSNIFVVVQAADGKAVPPLKNKHVVSAICRGISEPITAGRVRSNEYHVALLNCVAYHASCSDAK